MTTIVVLGAGPLGMVTNPRRTALNVQCSEWLESLLDRGVRVIHPEIADYEVRRELVRVGRTKGLQRLDEMKSTLEYLPLSTAAMLRATDFWAYARNRGTPTAEPAALDADAILAGQTVLLGSNDEQAIVATTNPTHLSLFVPAFDWQLIE
jgi:hypothetical protein